MHVYPNMNFYILTISLNINNKIILISRIYKSPKADII